MDPLVLILIIIVSGIGAYGTPRTPLSEYLLTFFVSVAVWELAKFL